MTRSRGGQRSTHVHRRAALALLRPSAREEEHVGASVLAREQQTRPQGLVRLTHGALRSLPLPRYDRQQVHPQEMLYVLGSPDGVVHVVQEEDGPDAQQKTEKGSNEQIQHHPRSHW